MCVAHITLGSLDTRISPKNGRLAYADSPKIGHLAEGAALPTRWSVLATAKATYGKDAETVEEVREGFAQSWRVVEERGV